MKRSRFTDAQIIGVLKEHRAGQLSAMIGCDEAVMERIRPVISCWASTMTRVGDIGTGHKMKLLMNFIGLSYRALSSEVVVLGAKVGISPAVIRDILAPSRMGNAFFTTLMAYGLDRDRDRHKFSPDNAAKDIRYVNDMAAEAGMVNIMAGAAKHYDTHAVAGGYGADYVPHLSDQVARLNGIDLKKVETGSRSRKCLDQCHPWRSAR
jgi:3-hydroxyisobutyrate dehydrogenase-like beta-hydroxyacid dehydrogenase